MGAKKHIVKINEEQYSYLKGSDDTKHFDGNNAISVSGKLNTDEDGQPKTTDDVAQMFTPQAYTYYRTPQRGKISEGEHVSNGDYDGDHVDDTYNVPQANILSNGNKDDNLTIVPQAIITKLDMLISVVKSEQLNPFQIANIANRFLESLDFSKLPYKAKKELRLKIN